MHLRAITGIASVAIVAVGLFAGLSALPDRASAAAGDVSIIALSCDTNPEYVRIKNFGGSSQSLSGFHIESDPSQDYTLTDFVSSIGGGQTFEFQSGSAAADSSGVYRMTGAFILRNSDPTNYARLVRPGAASDQVNCGETPTTPTAVPTSTASPTASPTTTATASPTGTATATPSLPPTPVFSESTIVNETGHVASDLHITVVSAAASLYPVSQNAPGCGPPAYVYGSSWPPVYSGIDIIWDTACVDPGESVTVRFASDCIGCGGSPPTVRSHYWTIFGTPIPTPTVTPPAGESVVWGDHNCSGSPDPVDSLLTLRYDAGLSANTGDCPNFGESVSALVAAVYTWGDVDCSDSVNPVDSLKLLRYDAGLSVSQTAGCPTIGGPI